MPVNNFRGIPAQVETSEDLQTRIIDFRSSLSELMTEYGIRLSPTASAVIEYVGTVEGDVFEHEFSIDPFLGEEL